MDFKTKFKTKFFLVIFAFLFLVFFTSATSTAAAAPAQRLDDQYIFTETQITRNESDQIAPAIFRDCVVWQDERNGNWDIYLYNLSTATETRITDNESNQTKPAIYGDRIVWQDDKNGNWDIYVYDISTDQETQVTDEPADQINPAIFKDRVVWQDKRNGNWDIYMYDLSDQTETQITNNGSDQIGPVIYGDRIVWQDESDKRELYLHELSTPRRLFNLFWNNQNFDLFSMITSPDNSKVQKILKKLTSEETSIASYGSNKYEPAAIYGNKVVWADKRNSSPEDPENSSNRTSSDNPGVYVTGIYIYDVSSSVETPVTTGFTLEESYLLPIIYENRIVWQDERNGNPDIYMYDLSASTETRITTDESGQEKPAIYGDRIVWTDDRNGNLDIYLCTLTPINAKPLSPVSKVYESGLNMISQFFGLS